MSRASYNSKELSKEDVWDDTALIKMYEDSISAATKSSTNAQSSNFGSHTWRVGERCMALFSEDGLWYPAEIVAVDGDSAEVLFHEYENREWVTMDDSLSREDEFDAGVGSSSASDNNAVERESSSSQRSRKASSSSDVRKCGAGKEQQAASSKRPASNNMLPSFAPPPPPSLAGLVPPSEVEALSSMLMSWYMSGYHTGYYQCLSDQKKEKK